MKILYSWTSQFPAPYEGQEGGAAPGTSICVYVNSIVECVEERTQCLCGAAEEVAR